MTQTVITDATIGALKRLLFNDYPSGHRRRADIGVLIDECRRARRSEASLLPLLDKLQDSDLVVEALRRERQRIRPLLNRLCHIADELVEYELNEKDCRMIARVIRDIVRDMDKES